MVEEFTLTVGAAVTVTVPDPELEHPPPKLYVTVYVVVEAGDTVILAVVCPPGDQEYVPPPVDGVAVNVADCPEQMVEEFTLTVGAAVTVTVPDPELEHPPPKLYVTVYVVVEAGDTVILAVV
jgi:hypothetical protein